MQKECKKKFTGTHEVYFICSLHWEVHSRHWEKSQTWQNKVTRNIVTKTMVVTERESCPLHMCNQTHSECSSQKYISRSLINLQTFLLSKLCSWQMQYSLLPSAWKISRAGKYGMEMVWNVFLSDITRWPPIHKQTLWSAKTPMLSLLSF